MACSVPLFSGRKSQIFAGVGSVVSVARVSSANGAAAASLVAEPAVVRQEVEPISVGQIAYNPF